MHRVHPEFPTRFSPCSRKRKTRPSRIPGAFRARLRRPLRRESQYFLATRTFARTIRSQGPGGFERWNSPPLSDRTLFYKYLSSFESIGGPRLPSDSFSSSPDDPPRPLRLTGFCHLFLLSLFFLFDPLLRPRFLTGFCNPLSLSSFRWKLSRLQRAVFVLANLLYVFRTRICIRNAAAMMSVFAGLCTLLVASVFDVGC